ncbi:MAG: exonuclease of the beta-lactamase fold involved in processing-like protein [Acidobacteria bacterium]|nr:exonuclease of the beta-lactamase fold involved in processing-like protein [Acidobacteriota bacterium]
MKNSGLVKLTRKGLYCERGDFYIDPWLPVRKAVLTHAHADHTYRGNQDYLVPREGELLSRVRLGEEARISTQKYGEVTDIDGVKVSFHPAGHVLGSAQVRVEYKGEIWVISGDYKLMPDATCAPFESVKCHHFITEATFGLPIYRWQPTEFIFEEINQWWRRNQEKEKVSVLFAYSLGKSQRVMNGIDRSIGKIFTHGAVERLTEAYRESGVDLPQTKYVGAIENKKDFAGSLIVAPPSAHGSTWLRKFGVYSTGFASGWMIVRGARRQKAVDRGFVLSDHADWTELQTAIRGSEAETVYVTHGFIPELVRWLNEQGINAVPLKTQYGDDEESETDVLTDQRLE